MGFYVGANYIFGFADDDNDTMKETLDLYLRINMSGQILPAMAYPGSQLYPMAVKKNGNFQMIKMAGVDRLFPACI